MGIHVGKPVRGRYPIIDSSDLRNVRVVAWPYDDREARRIAYNMRRSDEWNGKSRFKAEQGG